MNILIIPSWYPTSENPLSGIFFAEQAEALSKYLRYDSNNTVSVFVMQPYSILNLKSFFLTKKSFQTIEKGVPVWRYSYINIFPKFQWAFLKLSSYLLKKQINKIEKMTGQKFDIVHIHSALNAGIIYAMSNLSIPYVITEHSTLYAQGLISEVQKKRLPDVFNKASKIFVVGNGLALHIKLYTEKTCEILFNMVKCHYKPSDVKMTKASFLFFSLGLGLYKKGFDVLLTAFSKIYCSINASLCIAGLTDAEMNFLHKKIECFNIPKNNICLLGQLTRDEVNQFMTICDCFCLVSRFETFGVVFAEAMFHGKPIIATKTGGPDSFMTNAHGVLVDIEDVTATANAMLFIYNNIDQYNSKEIKAYAESKFSENVICAKLYNTYLKILNKL